MGLPNLFFEGRAERVDAKKKNHILTFLNSEAVLRIVVDIGGGSVACRARTDGNEDRISGYSDSDGDVTNYPSMVAPISRQNMGSS